MKALLRNEELPNVGYFWGAEGAPILFSEIGFCIKEKALTFVLSSFTATVLEGLFGEYHSSSAALGQEIQRPTLLYNPLGSNHTGAEEAF